jgi:hypothetical protein
LKPIENFLFAPPFPLEAISGTRAYPSLAPWRRAQTALVNDADAPLPV